MSSLVSADYGSSSSDECHSDEEYQTDNTSDRYENNENVTLASISDNESDEIESASDSLPKNG